MGLWDTLTYSFIELFIEYSSVFTSKRDYLQTGPGSPDLPPPPKKVHNPSSIQTVKRASGIDLVSDQKRSQSVTYDVQL